MLTAHRHPTLRIPLNVLCLVLTIVTLLMLINIASTSATYAILSLNNLALYTSYLQVVGSFFIFKSAEDSQLGDPSRSENGDTRSTSMRCASVPSLSSGCHSLHSYQ
jgi:amino acid transporter